MDSAITITFGDVAENHVGMQKLGTLSQHGFSFKDLEFARNWFQERESKCELISLHEHLPEDVRNENEAYVLIIKDGVNALINSKTGANDLMSEQNLLEKDTKAFMYGRVVNKKARYNLCFGETNQDPDYKNKKGRIVAFSDVPLLSKIRNTLTSCLGNDGNNLQAEGNYYYDIDNCGIGFHGETERKKVFAIRLGATIPLHYVWYKAGKAITKNVIMPPLNHGDIYIMSEKATGFDWKKKNIYTLRHAAGSKKYTTIKN